MFTKFHKWFDAIPEPKRFILFMCMIIPVIIGITCNVLIIQAISIVIFAALLLPRMFYLKKK